jgi:hypothetical protein
MRIIPTIFLFILLASPIYSQSTDVVKGIAHIEYVSEPAIYALDSEINFSELTSGKNIPLLIPANFSGRNQKSEIDLSLSDKMNIFFHGKGDLWIDNFEIYIDKDENGIRTNSDDFVANLRLKGSADFKVKKMLNNGYFSIQTDGADLDIKSTDFYISTTNNTTHIECYEGHISLTDSITSNITILKNGNVAEVYGSSGDKNTVIRIYPLKDWMIINHIDRINSKIFESLPKKL